MRNVKLFFAKLIIMSGGLGILDQLTKLLGLVGLWAVLATISWQLGHGWGVVGGASGLITVLLVYLAFAFVREDNHLTHAGNLAIKFAGLPYILSLAWTTVLPKFWAARPEMGFVEVWLGYVAVYAVATVLSQVWNPKQVL